MMLVINYKNEVLDKWGTGLIGSKLTSHLIDNGHSVNILSEDTENQIILELNILFGNHLKE